MIKSAATGLVARPLTKREQKRAREDTRRRQELEAEKWACDVTPQRVKCVACKQDIKLDDDGNYYPWNWYKHIDVCKVRIMLERLGIEVIIIRLGPS